MAANTHCLSLTVNWWVNWLQSAAEQRGFRPHRATSEAHKCLPPPHNSIKIKHATPCLTLTTLNSRFHQHEIWKTRPWRMGKTVKKMQWFAETTVDLSDQNSKCIGANQHMEEPQGSAVEGVSGFRAVFHQLEQDSRWRQFSASQFWHKSFRLPLERWRWWGILSFSIRPLNKSMASPEED